MVECRTPTSPAPRAALSRVTMLALGVLAFWAKYFQAYKNPGVEDMFGHVWTCLVCFTNLQNQRLEPKIHPIEKENHLNQTFSFWGSILIFPGCICVLLWRATLILCFFSGHVINFFWTIEVKGMTGLHVLKRMPSI